MKRQWGLIFTLIFALLIAFFSVVNVNSVKVNYIFGSANWPLILVILVSVLLGALLLGSFGIVRMFRLQRKISRLQKELTAYKENEEKTEQEKTEQVAIEEKAIAKAEHSIEQQVSDETPDEVTRDDEEEETK